MRQCDEYMRWWVLKFELFSNGNLFCVWPIGETEAFIISVDVHISHQFFAIISLEIYRSRVAWVSTLPLPRLSFLRHHLGDFLHFKCDTVLPVPAAFLHSTQKATCSIRVKEALQSVRQSDTWIEPFNFPVVVGVWTVILFFCNLLIIYWLRCSILMSRTRKKPRKNNGNQRSIQLSSPEDTK